MARRNRCQWYFCDPLTATDEQLDGAGRCPLTAAPGRPYCTAHAELARYRPGEDDPPPAEPEAVAPALPARPAGPPPTRAELTLRMLRRREGVTRTELHAAFEQQIGPTGASTARQALQKLPKRNGWGAVEYLGRQPGRGGMVMRLPPA